MNERNVKAKLALVRKIEKQFAQLIAQIYSAGYSDGFEQGVASKRRRRKKRVVATTRQRCTLCGKKAVLLNTGRARCPTHAKAKLIRVVVE